MVLSMDDEVNLENLKHAHKLEYENVRHKNEMEELAVQLQIAIEQAKKE